MRAMLERARLGVTLLAAGALSCNHPDPPLTHPRPLPSLERSAPPARVSRIERHGDLLVGDRAGGRLGDFRIHNDQVVVVIAGLARPRPGALVDAGIARVRADALGSLIPAVGRDVLRPPRYARADAEQLGGAATLRLTGEDPASRGVEVITEYSLHPGTRALRILTTVTNRSGWDLLQYQVGDLVDWGATTIFAPGIGRLPEGRPEVAWLSALAEQVSYGYFRREGMIAAEMGVTTSTAVAQTVDLPRGQRISVQRMLAIGGGAQNTDVLAAILGAQGAPSGRVEVMVVGDEGDTVPAATVEVRQRSRPFALARTSDEGSATLELPPGEYDLVASTADRAGGGQRVVLGAEHGVAARLRVGPPSRLLFDVRDKAGGPIPARLTLQGIEGTATPWLGPPFTARAGNTLLSPTGQGALPLPPGRYRVVASHGPEFTIHTEEVTLRPRSGGSLTARLERVVDTAGYVALDTAQCAPRGWGCAVSEADRLLTNLVEGVGAAVIVGAPAPLPATLRAGGVLLIPALRFRTGELGTVTAFPRRPELDPLEVRDTVNLDSGIPGALLQLDEARRPRAGLLQRTGFDASKPDPTLVPLALGALRIYDAARPEDFDRLFEDWLALLRSGREMVATAGSATTAIVDGAAGFPRTYVEVPAGGPADAARVVEALREGRAVVSCGPFVRLTVDGHRPGDIVALVASKGAAKKRRPGAKIPARDVTIQLTVSAPAWMVLDELVLYVDGKPHDKPIPLPGRSDGVRLERTLRVPVTKDTFILALVRGSGSLAPVARASLRPLALTNPVWIDFDGDGVVAP
jgi:hypothetical protein